MENNSFSSGFDMFKAHIFFIGKSVLILSLFSLQIEFPFLFFIDQPVFSLHYLTPIKFLIKS